MNNAKIASKLVVRIEKKKDKEIVHLSGVVDEVSDFDSVIGNLPKKVEINCKEVSRINSTGVENWIVYFQKASSKGVQLKFVECSEVIVEVMNMISNFICGGEVESLYVPFSCSKCDVSFNKLYPSAQLKKEFPKVPDGKCPKCGATVPLDNHPHEYFGFLGYK